MAAIRPAGARPRHLGAAEGRARAGESTVEAALREIAEETGVRGRALRRIGEERYWYSRGGERIFEVVALYLVRYAGGRLQAAAGLLPTRGRRGAGFRSRRRRSSSPTRPSASSPAARRSYSPTGTTYDRAPVPSFALNFYSPVVEAQLRSHRKTATIRLGDKSRKYQKGMIVAGARRRRAMARASTSSTRSSTRSRSSACQISPRARSSTTTPRSAVRARWRSF